MGVVQNSIDIQKIIEAGGDPTIAAKVAELEAEIGDENSGIIKDIDDLQEANALVMTSVSAIKLTADGAAAGVAALNTALTTGAVTITAAENVAIEVNLSYKVKNMVIGCVRFKIANENEGTSNIPLGTISDPPKDNYMRFICYNWGTTNNQGMVNISHNGSISTYDTSVNKNTQYYFNFVYVTE